MVIRKFRNNSMKSYFFVLVLIFTINLPAQVLDNTASNQKLADFSNISVTVGGDFIINGTFLSSINERVDQFITRLYNQVYNNSLRSTTDPKELLRLKKELSEFSLRGIKLIRANGEELILDLMKFRLNGDFTNNPYLKHDDVLIFPPYDPGKNFFSITGAVNKPNTFPFVEGDKLSDAIELAQGLNKAYENVTTARINRLSYEGTELEQFEISISEDIELLRGDRIEILANESWKKDFNVLVVGEVNSPGIIPITKNGIKLSKIIEMAGGFTQDADLRMARLFTGRSLPVLYEQLFGYDLTGEEIFYDKEFVNELTELENSLMYRLSEINEEDTSYFFLENKLRLIMNGGAMDFTKLNEEGSYESGYLVRDKDIIIIPRKDNTVYVFGQIPNPGKISYKEGKDYTYYINEAGGLTEYSEEVFIIKGKSREWITPEDSTLIEPGDYIWVKRDPVHSFNYYLRQISTYLSIVGSAATIVLLLIQLGK